MPVRILYVDDDPALVRLAERTLGRRGWEIVHTSTIEAAVDALKTASFDAVILDHYLQNTTGLELLSDMATMGIVIPVVYVTGSSEARIAIDALKNGAADYVIKSVTDDFIPLLASAVEQSLANAELRRSKERQEAELRRSMERAELLLAEVNHRVANSLALVAATIRMQITNSHNDVVKQALMETQARISAIAGMHRSLYTSDDVSQVELEKYLGNVLSDLQDTLSDKFTAVKIVSDLQPISISADRAVSVGMMVTELVTNAFKYAYPVGSVGDVRVSLHVEDGNAILSVEDDGVGWKETDTPKGTGLGTRIVKAMASTLGASTEFLNRDAGTHIRIHINLGPAE